MQKLNTKTSESGSIAEPIAKNKSNLFDFESITLPLCTLLSRDQKLMPLCPVFRIYN